MNTIQTINRSRVTMGLLLGGLFTLMLALNLLTPYIADDYSYLLNFSTKEPIRSFAEILPSMQAHSYKMNGRLVSHGIAQVFMLLPQVVFDVVNAAVFTGTLYLCYRLCNRGHERNAALFAAFFCLMWLYLPAFGQVVLWQVGAANYFWSLSACVGFFLPYLSRFQTGREPLERKWQTALFCVYAFFFGWYNEIASFVGICMALALMVLGLWMKRQPLKLRLFVPVVFAVLGYLAMFSMPAQTANKQASAMTMETLLANLETCNRMLAQYCLPLLMIWAVLMVLGLIAKLPREAITLSALFALAGVCANYMPIAASYYPERCMCTTVLMLVMANGFLAAPLSRVNGKWIVPACVLVTVLLFAATLPAGLRGCLDIVRCHGEFALREETIAASIEAGELDVTANVVVPATPYSGFWGLRDLSTEDPDTWPNHSMAIYYGIDSIIGE